jgi:hypothetical protein
MIIKPNEAIYEASNTIEVPQQTSFHTPAGQFSATIRSIKRTRRSWSSQHPIIRFIFNVNVPGSNVQYLAKLDLQENLQEGSDLWNVLCRLVGRKALRDCSGGQFDLNKLVGLSCDIETQHSYDNKEDHEFPLVLVTDLTEAGGLVCVNPGFVALKVKEGNILK